MKPSNSYTVLQLAVLERVERLPYNHLESINQTNVSFTRRLFRNLHHEKSDIILLAFKIEISSDQKGTLLIC